MVNFLFKEEQDISNEFTKDGYVIKDINNISSLKYIKNKIIKILRKKINLKKNIDDTHLLNNIHKFVKVKDLNNILIGHFLDIGWKNPYGETAAVIYAGTNSSQDREGRMRIDETECPGGYANGARIVLWVKTDKDYYPTTIEKDGWCK